MLEPPFESAPLVDFAGIHPVEGSVGQYLQVFEASSGQIVIVYLFGDRSDAAEVAKAIESANRLCAAPHVGLVRSLGGKQQGHQAYVVYERINGIRLVEVLRRRGRLEVSEAIRIFRPLADAFDHAVAHELDGLDLRISSIRLVPEGSDADPINLLESRLAEWPDFQVRIGYEYSHPSSASAFVKSKATDRVIGEAQDDFARFAAISFGCLCCELLGGARPTFRHGRHRFIPVAGLPDSLNQVLRKMISPPFERGYADAQSFLKAFESAWEHADEKTRGALLPQHPPYARSGNNSLDDVTTGASNRKRSRAILVAILLIAAVGIGVASSPAARDIVIGRSAQFWSRINHPGATISNTEGRATEPVVVTVPPEGTAREKRVAPQPK